MQWLLLSILFNKGSNTIPPLFENTYSKSMMTILGEDPDVALVVLLYFLLTLSRYFCTSVITIVHIMVSLPLIAKFQIWFNNLFLKNGKALNTFKPSVAFHRETCHLI